MANAMNPATRGAAPAARLTGLQEHSEMGRLSRVAQGIGNRLGVARDRAEERADWEVSQAGAAYEHADEELNPVDRDKSVMHNMIGGAITFGMALMIIVLMALVTGYFATEVPSEGAFNESIDTAVDIGGTGFIIFAVTLLAVPVVALIGYFMRSGLGGFMGGGGMGR